MPKKVRAVAVGIALLVAAAPAGASAQTRSAGGMPASPGTIGPIVLPNAAGTIRYQGTGGTTVASGGTTVFHGTGPTATITIIGGSPGITATGGR